MQNVSHFSTAKLKFSEAKLCNLTVTYLLDQIQNSENEMLEAHSMLGRGMKTPPEKMTQRKREKGRVRRDGTE